MKKLLKCLSVSVTVLVMLLLLVYANQPKTNLESLNYVEEDGIEILRESPNKLYFEDKDYDDAIAIEAAPQNLDEFLMCLAPFMYMETTSVKLDLSHFPLTDYTDIQSWPEDGHLENYTIAELFWPGTLLMDNESDFVGEDLVKYSHIYFSGEDNHIRVLQRCKELAASVTGNTNQEKMASVIDILNSVGTYEKGKYDPYDLLFNGKGNCMAYSNAVDCMARWLGIPCGEVSSASMNHEWNIFFGSDGQIYEMDATNRIYPGPLGTTKITEHYGSMDYQDTELQLLEYDRKLIEYHGSVSLPPSTEIVPQPTETPQEENQEEPAEQPEQTPTEETPTEETDTASEEDVSTTPTEEPTEPEATPAPTQEEVPQEPEVLPAPQREDTPTSANTIQVPTITSITAGNRMMTVEIAGYPYKYEVRYKSDNDSHWMSYTSDKASFNTYGLTSGATYYVQARSVKLGSDYVNSYSDWTMMYEITIK